MTVLRTFEINQFIRRWNLPLAAIKELLALLDWTDEEAFNRGRDAAQRTTAKEGVDGI